MNAEFVAWILWAHGKKQFLELYEQDLHNNKCYI